MTTPSVLKLLCQYSGRKSFAYSTFLQYIQKDLTGIGGGFFNSARLFSESKDDTDSSSDEENSKSNPSVNKRLNRLIKSMDVVRPTDQLKPGFHRSFYDEVKTAAKDVAETIGGDSTKTESDLLSRLLTRVEKNEQKTKSSGAKKPVADLSELLIGMKINRETKMPPEPSPERNIRGEMLSQMPTESRSQRSINREMLSQVTSEPSAQRSISEEMLSQNAEQRRGRVDPRSFRRTADTSKRTHVPPAKIDVFGSEALGIFKSSPDLEQPGAGVELRTWRHLAERELRLAVTQPPTNVFEEMIHWTQKGFLWHFPINNEQGAEAEAEVSFFDHVFLDQHLKPWCPTQGPIRHFMELVCVGLSKNSYFTAEEKKEHILWYRDYFMERGEILKTMGLSLNAEIQKTIE